MYLKSRLNDKSRFINLRLYCTELEQTFEAEVNTWDDIRWFDAQFIIIPNYSKSGILSYSRNFLDYNLFFSFRNQRLLPRNSTKITPDKIQLPTIYYQFEHDLTNFYNSQETEKPSDIIFMMTKNEYFEFGKKLIKFTREYKMRLSNASIDTYIDTHGTYWNILGPESLLNEPLTCAILKLKVT